ncbi:MAG: SEC-C domain-containing protein [Candidatus Faecousia sp.]|nr:SEC-C domain-containing protein [Candidatus Faecousia sp.]
MHADKPFETPYLHYTTPIQKSHGVTESEEQLCHLGDNTFLSLWSYPNVFKKHKLPKELCDMLVVFDNHIIIFSDKACAFGDSGDIFVDWTRWYKKSILASIRQLCGAKTWISKFPDRICLDEKGEHDFPLKIEITKDTVFHLIAVAHGASEACKSYFRGGDGGLIISNEYVWDAQKQEQCIPFEVGCITPEKNEVVHILDDSSFSVILQELDTISDFVGYLSDKENFFRAGVRINAAGETELLANHINGLISGTKRGLSNILQKNPKATDIAFEEGLWNEVHSSDNYQKWKHNLEPSYFIDSLLKKTFSFVERGLSTSTDPSIDSQSQLFRYLVRDDREHRSALAQGFLSFFKKTTGHYRGTQIIYNQDQPDVCYLLFLMPHEQYMSDDDYRRVRYQMLEDYCVIAKADFPEAKMIIGIAHETDETLGSSEDFISLDAHLWTTEDKVHSNKIKQEYIDRGLLGKRNVVSFNYRRTEEAEIKRYKGRDRNKACPCGSGKKYKKCCGRSVIS